MNRFFVTAIVFTVAPSTDCFGGVATQAQFFQLPGLQGALRVSAVSADGRVVAGHRMRSSFVGAVPFTWTIDGGFQDVLAAGVAFEGNVNAISGDGSTLVGYRNGEGFHWSAATGLRSTGYLSTIYRASTAISTSFDGSVVIGQSVVASGLSNNTRGFRWTSAGGIVSLGALPGGQLSMAEDVSADGSIIVGQARASNNRPVAAVWTQPTGWQPIPALPNEIPNGFSDANVMNSTGTAIAGISATTNSEREGWIWTAASGTVSLGLLGGPGSQVHPTAITDDGKTVVGFARIAQSYNRAFIWTEDDGIRLLDDMARDDLGLDLSLSLEEPTGISADGKVIVGTTGSTGWVLVVPAPTSSLLFGSAGWVLARRRRR